MTYQNIIDHYNKIYDNKIVRFVNNEMTTVYYFESGAWVDQFDLQDWFENETEYKNASVEELASILDELARIA